MANWKKSLFFFIDIACEAAWQEVLKYVSLHSTEDHNTFIVARDQDAARFGSKLYHPGLVLSSVITILRFFETGSIRKKIAMLNNESIV